MAAARDEDSEQLADTMYKNTQNIFFRHNTD
jgi:Tat protein secretion system quality control protein TatD with DNase activity